MELKIDMHKDGGWCEIQSLTANGWIRCKGLGVAVVSFPDEMRFYDGDMYDHMPFLASILNVCFTHSAEIRRAYTKRFAATNATLNPTTSNRIATEHKK